MGVIWAWSGGETPTSAVVAARVDTGPVRVLVADNEQMHSPARFGPASVDATGVAKVSLTGLDPDSVYWYRIEDNGAVDTGLTGRLLTHPVLGEPASYRVGVVSCAAGTNSPGTGFVTGTSARVSNHQVFSTLRARAIAERWAGLVHEGDLHYWDLGSGNHGVTGGGTEANYRTAYDDVMAQDRQLALYSALPTWYVWDDHDFGPNDADGTLATKANAATVFRERVPHHTLTDASGIWRAIPRGRVLWVISDVRYHRSPNGDTDNASKTMLGAGQKAWLEDLLTTSDMEALVWLMPDQWLGTGADSWGSFTTERAELIELFGDTGWLPRMGMVGGDRHALGLDTGTQEFGGFPVLQASSLDSQDGTMAPVSGRFDTGPDSPGSDRYGTVDVVDRGSHIALRLSGWIGTDLWKSHTTAFNVGGSKPSASTKVIEGTISRPHTVRYEARAVAPGQAGEDPDGTEIPILSGDVQLDGTADVWANLQLETEGHWWPQRASDQLAPYGQEVFVRVGLDLGGGGILWTPLGYFRINSPEQDNATRGPIRLTCPDRMANLIDGRLTSPVQLSAGSVVGEVVRSLVTDVLPNAEVVFDDAFEFATLGRSVTIERKRFDGLKEIVRSAGKIWHWDGEGRLQIRTAPDPDRPLWHARAGRDGVLVRAGRALTREGVRNGVVVEGEGASDDVDPVHVVVVDDGPNSPTRWGGDFGKVPRFYSSSLITTEAQAEATGREMLRRNLGMPHTVSFEQVPNPRLRPFDPSRIVHDDGTRRLHIAETVTIPLDAGATQQVTTQEQTTVLPRRL